MKSKFILLGLVPLLLASCGDFDNSLYNKTYNYTGKLCYNLESAVSYTDKKTEKQYIIEQMNADNIDWTRSGGVNSGLFVSEIVPFEKHGTYDEMISSMESMAKVSFQAAFKDGFKLEIKSKDLKKAVITVGTEVKEYDLTVSSSGSDGEDYGFYIKDNGETIGEIKDAAISGYGVYNGVHKCLDVEYKSLVNRGKFCVTFKKNVEISGSEYGSIEWYVFSQITNGK